jgi:hypothetical protein
MKSRSKYIVAFLWFVISDWTLELFRVQRLLEILIVGIGVILIFVQFEKMDKKK